MNIINQHRGDRDGKKKKNKKAMVEIYTVQLYFENRRTFDRERSNVERVMEQLLNTKAIHVVVDTRHANLKFRKENKSLMSKTANQLRLMAKSWEKSMEKSLNITAKTIKISNGDIVMQIKE